MHLRLWLSHWKLALLWKCCQLQLLPVILPVKVRHFHVRLPPVAACDWLSPVEELEPLAVQLRHLQLHRR